LGFRVKRAPGTTEIYGYLNGPDSLRASEFNAAYNDPEVDALVCLKGGYGTPRILDRLDYAAMREDPKMIAGYSDITGIHLAVSRLCGIPTVHGPMPASDFLPEADPESLKAWLSVLTCSGPVGILRDPPGSPPRRTLRGGRARGAIIGGNLSLVAALMGTPYEIDTRGKILFLEDIGEAPYRIDRMLSQLRLSGKLDECAGILLGDWKDCESAPGKKSLSLDEVVRDILLPCGKPLMSGIRAGHCSPTLSLPLGLDAVMDADALSIEITESLF